MASEVDKLKIARMKETLKLAKQTTQRSLEGHAAERARREAAERARDAEAAAREEAQVALAAERARASAAQRQAAAAQRRAEEAERRARATSGAAAGGAARPQAPPPSSSASLQQLAGRLVALERAKAADGARFERIEAEARARAAKIAQLQKENAEQQKKLEQLTRVNAQLVRDNAVRDQRMEAMTEVPQPPPPRSPRSPRSVAAASPKLTENAPKPTAVAAAAAANAPAQRAENNATTADGDATDGNTKRASPCASPAPSAGATAEVLAAPRAETKAAQKGPKTGTRRQPTQSRTNVRDAETTTREGTAASSEQRRRAPPRRSSGKASASSKGAPVSAAVPGNATPAARKRSATPRSAAGGGSSGATSAKRARVSKRGGRQCGKLAGSSALDALSPATSPCAEAEVARDPRIDALAAAASAVASGVGPAVALDAMDGDSLTIASHTIELVVAGEARVANGAAVLAKAVSAAGPSAREVCRAAVEHARALAAGECVTPAVACERVNPINGVYGPALDGWWCTAKALERRMLERLVRLISATDQVLDCELATKSSAGGVGVDGADSEAAAEWHNWGLPAGGTSCALAAEVAAHLSRAAVDALVSDPGHASKATTLWVAALGLWRRLGAASLAQAALVLMLKAVDGSSGAAVLVSPGVPYILAATCHVWPALLIGGKGSDAEARFVRCAAVAEQAAEQVAANADAPHVEMTMIWWRQAAELLCSRGGWDSLHGIARPDLLPRDG